MKKILFVIVILLCCVSGVYASWTNVTQDSATWESILVNPYTPNSGYYISLKVEAVKNGNVWDWTYTFGESSQLDMAGLGYGPIVFDFNQDPYELLDAGTLNANLGSWNPWDINGNTITFTPIGSTIPIDSSELIISFASNYGPNTAIGPAGNVEVLDDFFTNPVNYAVDAPIPYVGEIVVGEVPEPATFAYAAMGLISVFGLKRRFKK